MADGPAPIAGVCVLALRDDDQPSVQCLGFGAAVGAVTEHGFHLADELAAITRQAFEHASALAAAVPVWALRCPRGLDRLDRTVAFLAELDAGRGSGELLGLQGVELGVDGAEGHQLVVGAGLGDPAVEQDHDVVGAAHGGEAVGDEHDHAVPAEGVEAFEEVPLGSRVQGGGGLVHHDQGGVAEEGPGDGHPLPLADRQLGAAAEGGGQAGVIALGEGGQEPVRAGLLGRRFHAFPVLDPVDVAEADGLLGRVLEAGEVLEHRGHP